MATSVFDIIFKWSNSLPLWQRDTLRRLIVKGDLTDNNINELIDLCKIENGYPVTIQPFPVVSPLSKADIPTYLADSGDICLCEIRNVQNVNAQAPDQVIPFFSKGLTVVYSDNASEKSGYARILKQCCRSRARGERILLNVFKQLPSEPASATISFKIGDAEKQLFHWREGTSLPELSQISFFDIKCAPVYVNQENEVAFTPFGLDLLPRLANTCLIVQSKLKEERQILGQQKPHFLKEPKISTTTKIWKSY